MESQKQQLEFLRKQASQLLKKLTIDEKSIYYRHYYQLEQLEG